MTAAAVRVYCSEAKFEFQKDLRLPIGGDGTVVLVGTLPGLVTVACLAGAAMLYLRRP